MIEELKINHRDDIKKKMEALEKEGKFDQHLYPIDWEATLPVGADFPYIPKGFLRFKYFLTNLFIIKIFRFYQAKIVYRLKVRGKENLKGIKSAILTSNHVAIFDCLVNAYALRPRKVKTVGAEFNNRKGRFGGYMRAGGMLPLSSNRDAMRAFNKSIEHYTAKNNLILFYPEQSMWELYEKPRPFKSGAFHFAAKLNLPVVPMFITFREPKKQKHKDKQGKYFTLNILKPIYGDDNLSLIERTNDLKERAYASVVDAYEKAYGKTFKETENTK